MMETRTIREIKVYKLVMNNMTFPKIEMCEIVAVSTDYQKLIDWYKSQLANEGWRDGQWFKSFKKGSALEWYNPVSNLDLDVYRPFNQGIQEEWITEETYQRIMAEKMFLFVE
jgi:hypothetical protein